jgi:Tol biopolymer transport system component
MAVSPTGDLIAFSLVDGTPEVTLSSVFSVRIDATGLTELAAPQSNYPDFSPDGAAVAYSTGDGRICVVELDGPVDCLPSNGDYAVAPQWSPDGHWIAYCAQTGVSCTTVVVEPDGSSPMSIMPQTHSRVDWSPDSRYIALAQCYRSGCHLFVADIGACRDHRLQCLTSFEQEGSAHSPEWSPDGARVAFLSGDLQTNDIVVIDAECFMEPSSCERSAAQLTPAGGRIASFAWSPDSRQLAYLADTGSAVSLRIVQVDGSGTLELHLAGEPALTGLTELAWR